MQIKEGFYNRAYYGTTFLDPIGGAAVLTLGGLLLALPRRLALLPFIVLICFVPCTQRVSVAGLDFNLMRILLIFGWSRMIMRGEIQSLKLIKLDKLIIAYALTESAVYFALRPNFGSIITMSGRMGEALGGYFLVRCFVRDWNDVFMLARVIAIISIPVAITFIIEKRSGSNLFSVFGGVPKVTMIRDGRLRATGALGNPILAGCYWAALVPMMGALWWSKKSKMLGLLGVASGIIVVIACASSTPLGALMAGFMGGFLVLFRHKMSTIRKSILWTLVFLHIVMNHPVWHLLSRISLVGGSTGYHRFHLIDEWINHFTEWALRGVKGTAHWGWGLADITNQYVLESVRGGLAATILFFGLIVVSFRYVGHAWKAVEHDPERLAMAWGLGTCIFTHCMAFIAVSYFGQMHFNWYMHLALAACMMQMITTAPEPTNEPEEQEPEPIAMHRSRRLLGAT